MILLKLSMAAASKVRMTKRSVSIVTTMTQRAHHQDDWFHLDPRSFNNGQDYLLEVLIVLYYDIPARP